MFVVTPAIVANPYACPAGTKSAWRTPRIGLHLELYRGLHLGTSQEELKLDFMHVQPRVLRHGWTLPVNFVCVVVKLRQQLPEEPHFSFQRL